MAECPRCPGRVSGHDGACVARPTDDVRKQVAERLREFADSYSGYGVPVVKLRDEANLLDSPPPKEPEVWGRADGEEGLWLRPSPDDARTSTKAPAFLGRQFVRLSIFPHGAVERVLEAARRIEAAYLVVNGTERALAIAGLNVALRALDEAMKPRGSADSRAARGER